MDRTRGTFVNSVLVFVAGSSYGFIVPVIKTAVGNGIYPTSFLPMQYLFAFALGVVAMIVTRTRWVRPAGLAKMALLGVCTGCTSICYYQAVSLLPSAVALTLLFQYVWVSIAIDCIVSRRLPDASSVGCAAIVLVGTFFAAGIFDGSIGGLDPVGVAFGAGSAVMYALYLYLSGVLGTEHPVVLRTTMLGLGGLVVTSLVNPLAYTGPMFDVNIWPISIGLSFLGIIIPTALINFASPKLSSGMVSIMASSELPVGILAAWAFVGDTPTPLVLFGSALVLAGIFLKQLPALLHRA